MAKDISWMKPNTKARLITACGLFPKGSIVYISMPPNAKGTALVVDSPCGTNTWQPVPQAADRLEPVTS